MDALRAVVTIGVAVVVLAFQSELSSPESIASGEALPPAGAGVLLAVLYVSAVLFGLAVVLRETLLRP
jgi:hypothetical protein